MKKLTLQNLKRNPLSVCLKTVDGTKSFTCSIPGLAKFEMSDSQMTGDITTKVANGYLKLISTEEGFGTSSKGTVTPPVEEIKQLDLNENNYKNNKKK